MDSDRFEQCMRELEYFHALCLLPGAWTVVRVDGRGFSRLTQSAFDKPFDNPIRNERVVTTRRRIAVDHALPMREEYDAFIHSLLAGARVGSDRGGAL